MKIVSIVLNIVLEAIKYFTSKNFREKKKKEKKVKDRIKLEKAVRNEDKKEINKRIKKLLIISIIFIPILSGCSNTYPETTVFVDEELAVEPIEYKGNKGWWVPNPTMIKLLDKLEQQKINKNGGK